VDVAGHERMGGSFWSRRAGQLLKWISKPAQPIHSKRRIGCIEWGQKMDCGHLTWFWLFKSFTLLRPKSSIDIETRSKSTSDVIKAIPPEEDYRMKDGLKHFHPLPNPYPWPPFPHGDSRCIASGGG
jgi:hypothetical protein